jgi:hypothetical protein
MSTIRRILGVLVMCAGVLGLVLSLAGLIGVWVLKPTIASSLNSTIVTLNSSIITSQKAMEITGEALGSTIDSVNALSTMLGATAASVENTQPVLDQFNGFLGESLPSSLRSATTSLETAQQGAEVLDSAIRSLNTFRTLLSAAPLIGSFVEQPDQPYNPDKSLAESLGDLAADLEGLPDMFTQMAANLDKADDNLATIQSSLTIMSGSVGQISGSLAEYQAMIAQSQASMASVMAMLTNLQNNLASIMNVAAIILSLFFLWLLAAQVVIFSQGYELFQGTAGRMEGGEDEPGSVVVEETEPSTPEGADAV